MPVRRSSLLPSLPTAHVYYLSPILRLLSFYFSKRTNDRTSITGSTGSSPSGSGLHRLAYRRKRNRLTPRSELLWDTAVVAATALLQSPLADEPPALGPAALSHPLTFASPGQEDGRSRPLHSRGPLGEHVSVRSTPLISGHAPGVRLLRTARDSRGARCCYCCGP